MELKDLSDLSRSLDDDDDRVSPLWASQERYGFERMCDPSMTSEDLQRLDQRRLAWEEEYYENVMRYQLESWAKLGWAPEIARKVASKSDPTALSRHKKLLRKGLPPKLRADFWYLATGASQLEKNHDPHFFRPFHGDVQTIVADALDVESLLKREDSVHSEAERIEKDLDRTFPNHPYFRSDRGRRCLRKCLLAFSVHVPSVGYAQSINFVAAVLNLFYTPRKAFWMLFAVVSRILPPEFYNRSLLGCKIETRVLEGLMQRKMPRLVKHIKCHNIDVSVVCISWYLCIFLNTLPIETALRVWDALFLERDKVLHRIALALFKLNESSLLACQETHEIYQLLTRLGRDQYDCDELLNIAFNKLGALRRSTIGLLRNSARAAIIEEDNRIQARRDQLRGQKLPVECEDSWTNIDVPDESHSAPVSIRQIDDIPHLSDDENFE